MPLSEKELKTIKQDALETVEYCKYRLKGATAKHNVNFNIEYLWQQLERTNNNMIKLINNEIEKTLEPFQTRSNK